MRDERDPSGVPPDAPETPGAGDFATVLGLRWRPEERAVDPAGVRARHEANRVAWNEAAGAYRAEFDAALSRLRAGKSNLHPVERANLGDLAAWCRTAIHLQCASGEDTLSLWIEGVPRVVGVDISEVHIENARRLAEALGAPAEWHRCDVLDAPHELDGSADLVYTGRGALCWLHDLDAWARVIARLLRPGGVFHVLDDHPVTLLFDAEAESIVATGADYFPHAEMSQGWPASYLGDLGRPVEEHAPKHEMQWTLADVFGALRGAGLVIEHLGEHREEYWRSFPNLRAESRGRIPMTFSIMARRP